MSMKKVIVIYATIDYTKLFWKKCCSLGLAKLKVFTQLTWDFVEQDFLVWLFCSWNILVTTLLYINNWLHLFI